jgi:hypothetical protein
MNVLCSVLGSAVVGAACVAGAQPDATTQPAAAPAAPPAKPAPPPAYTVVRWNEDYGYLKDPAKRGDLFDAIKYTPLNERGDWYLSLGGQARYRYELFNNNNFGAGPQDDTGFHLTRLLAHADVHLGNHLRGFFQVKSGMEDGRDGGPRPPDADEFDLEQAFIDLKLPVGELATVTLRGGRQNLVYGVHRLIGPLDWTNGRRTFEGGKATVAFSKTHSLDLFWVRPVLIDKEEPNQGDSDASFAGIYDILSLPKVWGETSKSQLELYGLALNRQDATYPGAGVADEDRYTVGARFSSAPKPFDVDVEADYQFGKFGSGDVSAWSLAVEGGYTFEPFTFSPRVYLGFDMASGDDDPSEPDLQTFNQLFPTGHPFFGYIDVIGRQNIIDIHPGAELTLLKEKPRAKKVALRADYHLFWRQSDADAVYNAGGGVLRADLGSEETYIGSEVDLLLNWQIDRHLATYLGYSHFFAGDFIEETGPGEDIDFFYAALTFTF